MKNILVSVFILFFAGISFAESYVECKRTGGSEQGLMVSPKSFSLDEAGEVTLSANYGEKTKVLLSLEVGEKDGFYYASQAIKLKVGAEKNVLGEKLSGMEIFAVAACKNEESTTAVYNFEYKDGKSKESIGAVTYDCQCGLD